MERLRVAVAYGADAVYVGGKHFSLRAAAGNFDGAELCEAVQYAHAQGVKVYVAVNIFAQNDDLNGLPDYLRELCDAEVDALIVADPGVFALARETVPQLPIHISTQANVTNFAAVQFWQEAGAQRIVLAREVPLSDIRIIREHCPSIALEAFVHGAMCVAYSGRCLLSAYLTSRSANRGDCAHACRYVYRAVEEKRFAEWYKNTVAQATREGVVKRSDAVDLAHLTVEEDVRGTTLFAANDLCMAAHLPAMVDAGISCLKIEGRMKSAFYVAVATRTYRRAIDDYFDDPVRYAANIPWYENELRRCARAGDGSFSTGFYFGKPDVLAQDYASPMNSGSGIAIPSFTGTFGVETTNDPTAFQRTQSAYVKRNCYTHAFAGIVRDYDAVLGRLLMEQRNKFSVGDTVEVLRARGESFTQTVRALYDADGLPVNSTPHPGRMYWMETEQLAEALDMVCVRSVDKART